MEPMDTSAGWGAERNGRRNNNNNSNNNNNITDRTPPPTPISTPRFASASGGGAGGGGGVAMTDQEQRQRRASIKEIMENRDLTPLERRRSIQSLMDGRRRSSAGAGSVSHAAMAAAAAAAAADFSSSSCGSDGDDHDDLGGNLENDDDLSVASSLTSCEGGGAGSGGGARGGGGGVARGANSSGMMGGGNENGGEPNSASGTGGGTKRRRDSLRSSFTMNFGAMAVGGGVDGTESPLHPGMMEGGRMEREDSVASYSSASLGSAIGSSRRMEKNRPECTHYERNCSIVSPCCGLAFGCRICHDDCPVLPPPIFLRSEEEGGDDKEEDKVMEDSSGGGGDSEGGGSERPARRRGSCSGRKRRVMRSSSLPTSFHEEETHHNIDRFAIKEVICRKCYTRQSSKSNKCVKCNIQFGEYHCNICNLWMSAEEEPYHCADCGFCRVGGRENFRHCQDCGMCIDALLFDDHNCKTGKYMSNCPVCQEDLFSSRFASHEMPCGHAIHWHCFRELTSFDTRCPVCKKTAETREQMAPTWSAMAMGIALQPVPPDLARVVTILCNDCEEHDVDRRWHFLGVQCLKCSSFNTTVESTTLVGHEAAAFLGDHDQADQARAAALGAAASINTNAAAAVVAAGAAGIPSTSGVRGQGVGGGITMPGQGRRHGYRHSLAGHEDLGSRVLGRAHSALPEVGGHGSIAFGGNGVDDDDDDDLMDSNPHVHGTEMSDDTNGASGGEESSSSSGSGERNRRRGFFRRRFNR